MFKSTCNELRPISLNNTINLDRLNNTINQVKRYRDPRTLEWRWGLEARNLNNTGIEDLSNGTEIRDRLN